VNKNTFKICDHLGARECTTQSRRFISGKLSMHAHYQCNGDVDFEGNDGDDSNDDDDGGGGSLS